MNYKEISFQTLLKALRNHWRAYLLTVVFFCLLGMGAGWLYAPKAAVSGGWSVQALDPVDYSNVQEDVLYYESCLTKLAAVYANADEYLRVISEDSTVTTVQQTELTALRRQMNILKEEDYQPIQAALSVTGSLYLPKAAREAGIESCEQKLFTTRLNLIQAKAAADLIRTMDAPGGATDETNATYEELLAQAQMYTQYLRDEALYREMLRQIKEDEDRLDENCRKMDRLLSTAADHLNSFLEELTAAAQEIAAENSLILSVVYGQTVDTIDTASITLSHTHRAASGEEAFAIMTLFCTLLGICGSAFLTICLELYGPRKQKD